MHHQCQGVPLYDDDWVLAPPPSSLSSPQPSPSPSPPPPGFLASLCSLVDFAGGQPSSLWQRLLRSAKRQGLFTEIINGGCTTWEKLKWVRALLVAGGGEDDDGDDDGHVFLVGGGRGRGGGGGGGGGLSFNPPSTGGTTTTSIGVRSGCLPLDITQKAARDWLAKNVELYGPVELAVRMQLARGRTHIKWVCGTVTDLLSAAGCSEMSAAENINDYFSIGFP